MILIILKSNNLNELFTVEVKVIESFIQSTKHDLGYPGQQMSEFIILKEIGTLWKKSNNWQK